MGNPVCVIIKDWEKDGAFYPSPKIIDGLKKELEEELKKEIPPRKLWGGIIYIEPTIIEYNDFSRRFIGYDIKLKEPNLFTLYVPNKE